MGHLGIGSTNLLRLSMGGVVCMDFYNDRDE